MAHENHLLDGQDCEDPFGDWGPDPVHPGQGAAEWACPKKTPVAGQGAAEWACPSGRAADWEELKRRAGPQAARLRALVLGEAVRGGRWARKALTVAQMGEAEAASLHWR